jgi:sugar transferase (PEP-CTERM/EpsH1 system associated)
MAPELSQHDHRPLVVHVVYRFDTGGLENGIVNLINHLPSAAYRHAIVALTEVTDFRQRVRQSDVVFIALHKGPGHAAWLYPKLFALMRRLRPAVVHTRNLATLEVVVPAWLAGVPVRLHGEHGRDVGDLDGSNRKYQWIRRLYRPFVTHYVALSRDLRSYLVERVGIPSGQVAQVCNGVDVAHFRPATATGLTPDPILGCPFDPTKHWLVGSVGRMQAVKNQTTLTRAFIQVVEASSVLRERLRLVLIGDGPLRAKCRSLLEEAGVAELAWLPGERDDVPELMRGLHCFVLPSLAEGISNTILEAMASGLPVIATDVGGNADLVVHTQTGLVVRASDVTAMAEAISGLAFAPEDAAAMGRAGRARVEAQFSLQGMVAAYRNLYDHHLGRVRQQLQGA